MEDSNMNTLRRCLFTVLTALLVLGLAAGTASAQKSQKSEKPKPVQSAPSTIKDILQKYEGKATSLGELKQVAGDYFVAEQEGVSTMYPFSAIHSLRPVKDEETGAEVLEIHLMARD
jgi:hypothetical protein